MSFVTSVIPSINTKDLIELNLLTMPYNNVRPKREYKAIEPLISHRITNLGFFLFFGLKMIF